MPAIIAIISVISYIIIIICSSSSCEVTVPSKETNVILHLMQYCVVGTHCYLCWVVC